LAGVGSFLLSDGTLTLDIFSGNTVGAQRLRLGSGDMHGDILAYLVVTGEVYQCADAATVHIAGEVVSSFETLETTDGHVFANLANQGSTHGLDSTVAESVFAQGCYVGRRLFGDQLGHIVDECDEIIVL